MVFFLCAAEQARVSLSPLRGMKGADYINASYIAVNPKKICPNGRIKLIRRLRTNLKIQAFMCVF